jgi:UDP-glucose 4-epimerase
VSDQRDRPDRSQPVPASSGTTVRLARPLRRLRRVAVTGTSSLLGRNLVGLLEEDASTAKIVALDVVAPPTAGRKTRFYSVDLTRPAVDARLAEILGAEEVDTVVHLAFLGSPSRSVGFAHELESVGTMHLLNACREQRIPKFVMRSTTAVYGALPSHPNFLVEHHPTPGVERCGFVKDKLDAEREARRYAQQLPEACVVVLRFAPILGPTANNYVTRWLSRRAVPTVLGYDPLVQLLHEMDALAALRLALSMNTPGTFNVVGEGVLPLSTVIKLAGRMPLPLPWSALRRATGLLWLAGAVEVPPAMLPFLRWPCVADGSRAVRELGFRPAYTTRETVLDFGGALRLREARLLQETA